MAGAMRRMGVYLGLVEDDEYEDEYAHASGAAERVPARRDHSEHLVAAASRSDYAETRYPRDSHRSSGHSEHHEAAPYSDDYSTTTTVTFADEYPQYQITAVHPRTYNEARTIGEHFRNDTPVIMNLTDMEDADAKRLVDFAAGLTFGLRGRIERVTNKVFLLSPANVSVTAADRAKMAETGFFNQS